MLRRGHRRCPCRFAQWRHESRHKALTYVGISGIGILLALIFLIGLISLNAKILASAIPFLVMATVTVRHHRARA